MSSATSQTSATAVDLSIDLAGVALRNPILSASGTFGHGLEMRHFVGLQTLSMQPPHMKHQHLA